MVFNESSIWQFGFAKSVQRVRLKQHFYSYYFYMIYHFALIFATSCSRLEVFFCFTSFPQSQSYNKLLHNPFRLCNSILRNSFPQKKKRKSKLERHIIIIITFACFLLPFHLIIILKKTHLQSKELIIFCTFRFELYYYVIIMLLGET